MSLLLRVLPALLLAPVLACGDTECSGYEFPLSPPPASAIHLSCSSTACGDGLNPPTSGDHCGNTLSCRVYDTEQNRCVWLHNLEHGHAVFLYNCPEGCPDVVAALDSLRQEAGFRAVVAPDSRIPHRVAALLWRRAWVSDTMDSQAVRCLLKQQDVDAPEPGLTCQP